MIHTLRSFNIRGPHVSLSVHMGLMICCLLRGLKDRRIAGLTPFFMTRFFRSPACRTPTQRCGKPTHCLRRRTICCGNFRTNCGKITQRCGMTTTYCGKASPSCGTLRLNCGKPSPACRKPSPATKNNDFNFRSPALASAMGPKLCRLLRGLKNREITGLTPFF